MSEEQSKWWQKKGAKKYRGVCESVRPGANEPEYIIVFWQTLGRYTYNEPVFDFSETTVSGDVRLQAETNSFHFEERAGTKAVIGGAVYARDGARSRLVYAVHRESPGGGSGVIHPDKDTLEAALKWVAQAERLRK